MKVENGLPTSLPIVDDQPERITDTQIFCHATRDQ
jgi:hypothetical protein